MSTFCRMTTNRVALVTTTLAMTVGVYGEEEQDAGNGGSPQAVPWPDSISVTGIVRDFHGSDEEGGHGDFELTVSAGAGVYCGNIALLLDEDHKPVFTGEGFKVGEPWLDAAGNIIAPHVFDETLGDQAGVRSVSNTGGIQSAETFTQWYRDIPGVNLSAPLTLELVRQQDGTYRFDDELDSEYYELGGFFPIDDQHFGSGTGGHNYHFTFELNVEFRYDASGGQYVASDGDDDVWIFVDGKLVIDLGGVHTAAGQRFDIDRLGLVDGEMYRISVFYAERHRYSSTLQLSTNFPVRATPVPTVTSVGD